MPGRQAPRFQEQVYDEQESISLLMERSKLLDPENRFWGGNVILQFASVMESKRSAGDDIPTLSAGFIWYIPMQTQYRYIFHHEECIPVIEPWNRG